MRILTYNIHDGVGLDRSFRLDRIADLIRATGADLVGLQEVPRYIRRAKDVDTIRGLAETTGLYGVYGPSYTLRDAGPTESARGLDWPQFGNGLLSRYPVRWSEVHPLPYFEFPGSYLERRSMLEASIAAPEGNFTIYVTHFGLDPSERLQQALALSRRVGDAVGPVVVVGDLNAEPDSAPIQWLNRQLGQLKADVGALFTFPADLPDRQLDYIYVRGFEQTAPLDLVTTDASDHLPVLADVRWQTSSGTDHPKEQIP